MKIKRILCSMLCAAAITGAAAQTAIPGETEEQKDKRMEWKACTPPPTSIVVVEPATITPGIVVRIL